MSYIQRLSLTAGVFMIAVLVFGTLLGFNAGRRIWNPKGFAETSKWAKFSAWEVIDTIQWLGNEEILDIGTADGKVSSVLASKVPKGSVLAIDLSKEMINYAKEHYPKEQFPNLSFEIADGMIFHPNKQFDVITSFTVVHMMPDTLRAFENFASLLKPGGSLYLKFPIGDGFATALDTVVASDTWKEKFSNFHDGWYFHTKQDYENYLIAANLVPIYIEEIILDECYDTKEELTAAISYWLPHLQILTPEEQKRFLNDLVTLFLKIVPPDEKGRVHHYEPTIVIEAVK